VNALFSEPPDAPSRSAAAGMPVRVAGVVRRFAGPDAPVEVLAGIDLDVPASEFVALLGPSGCGKSTLLRLVAGLDAPDGGSLQVGGRPVGRREHPEAVAFVFQEAHLLPWRTLIKNVMLPLELRGMPARERLDRALHMLDRVGLADARDRYPAQLSGGMQLRGSLARALVTEPKLLLLDEPSSGLNVEETDDMAFWIDDIRAELGVTVLMVEHDMALVSRVSDRVLAMNQGEVLATGTPREVQNHPGVIEAYLGSVDDVSALRRQEPA